MNQEQIAYNQKKFWGFKILIRNLTLKWTSFSKKRAISNLNS